MRGSVFRSLLDLHAAQFGTYQRYNHNHMCRTDDTHKVYRIRPLTTIDAVGGSAFRRMVYSMTGRGGSPGGAVRVNRKWY